MQTLVAGELAAGVHEIAWDGRSDQGSRVASGVYFCETRFDQEVRLNKLALVK